MYGHFARLIHSSSLKTCHLFLFDSFDIFANVGLCSASPSKHEYIRFRSEFSTYSSTSALNGEVKLGMDLIFSIISVRLTKNNYESYGYGMTYINFILICLPQWNILITLYAGENMFSLS